MIIDRDLASVRDARAYQVGEFLLVRIAGDMPSACHVPFLERSLLDVEPPTFIAGWYIRPDARCAPHSTPYEHHEAFRIGMNRDMVKLHHAGGELSIDVEELTPDADSDVPLLGGRGVSPASGANLPTVSGEAVGYSRNFDFAEALQDAMAKLPGPFSQIPDWLSTYTVVSIGAEVGGIAGFNHLVVRVRGG